MMNSGFHQLLQLTDGQTDILIFWVEMSLTCCCGKTVQLQQSWQAVIELLGHFPAAAAPMPSLPTEL